MNDLREDMSDKVSQRERIIRTLESDVRKLEEQINQLNQDIALKSAEIGQVKTDAVKKLR